MTAPARKKDYATKAKVEHAVRMAEIAGITEIGSIELRPDGTIRVERTVKAPKSAPPSVEDEIAQWRAKRGK